MPGVAQADEPLFDTFENVNVPLERPDTASIENAPPDHAQTYGRAARVRYERLRAAGLVR
jgi:hypothetical protein